jgi:predicted DNA-binding transcriptional regulator AlpA
VVVLATPLDETLLTARQVAERLQVHVRTLWAMIARGEFPRGLRRNRRWVRWYARDITEYLGRLEADRRPV